MFDIGFSEILLIFGLSLVVLGPDKLPRVARTVGRWAGRARAMARQFRDQLEAEADTVKSSLDVRDAAKPASAPRAAAPATTPAAPATPAAAPEVAAPAVAATPAPAAHAVSSSDPAGGQPRDSFEAALSGAATSAPSTSLVDAAARDVLTSPAMMHAADPPAAPDPHAEPHAEPPHDRRA